MNILVTGAKGFIGKHTCLRFKKEGYNVFEYDINNTKEELNTFIKDADFIIHLAGINRPKTTDEFYKGNSNFTQELVSLIKDNKKNTPIIMTSSIQAELDNDYGKSKLLAEESLKDSGLPVYIYRLYNVFGKWCRPNYNSASATFSYNIAHDLPIEIRDRNYVVSYNYIDDIVDAFVGVVRQEKHNPTKEIKYVSLKYECSLGHLADLLYYFKNEVESDRHLPIIHNDFEYKLFKQFLDYLSDEGHSFNFASDNRGSFEELYKSKKYGQISANIIYPGITKGGHYHTYKKEIFYTVKGDTIIRQRNVNNDDLIEDKTNNDNPNLVNINPMYTHEITNIGKDNSVTLMWISEVFKEETPDTYREPVDKK